MEGIPTDIPKESEDVKEEKPRVFDIDKGWREQLTAEEIEKIKNWAKRIVKQWHDEVQPDYIFLTETSAIPFGYVLKETWKSAYSNEEAPKFHRVDPMYLHNAEKWGEKYEEAIPEFFRKIITKDNPRILVFDEASAKDQNWNNEQENDFINNTLHQYEGETKPRHGFSNSLLSTVNHINKSLVDKKPLIWSSQQAIMDILKNVSEGANQYKDRLKIERQKEYYGNNLSELARKSGYKSRLPTSKPEKSHSGDSDSDFTQNEDEIYNKSLRTWDGGKGLPTPGRRITGRVVKHSGQRERAMDYMNDLQELGREAGEELRRSLESNQE